MSKRKIAVFLYVVALFGAVMAAGMAPAEVYAQGVDYGDEVGMPRESRKIDIPAASPTPLSEILEHVRRDLGINLTASPELEGEKVKLMLVGVPWRKALEAVAERVGGQIVQVSSNWLNIEPMPKVTIKMQDADLALVLDQLATLSGANIVIAPDVKGKVSINLRNVPWRTAFDTIIKTLGYVVVEEDYNILRVVKPETLQAQLETEIFQLKYVRPPDQYKASFPTGGGGSRGHEFVLSGAQAPRGRGVEDFTLLKVLRNVLTPNVGKLEYDYDKNSIVVSDTKPKIKEMEELIAKIDTMPQQVAIGIKFIRTESIDLYEHGIRFNKVDTEEEDGAVVSAGFPAARSAADLGGTYEFDLGHWETIRDGFNAIGIIDFTQTQMMLKMIQSDENSRVVQSPTLLTLDNQEGIIFVGESVPYVKQTATVDQSGNVTVTIEEDSKSPISVGFTLFVTPHVIKDTDEIYLTIIPKTSQLTGTSDKKTGFESFEAGEGASKTRVDLPRTLDQTIVTKMLLKDGNTAVIGGLLTQRRVEKESRIPFFSAIPFIGGLFRWKRQVNKVENLVIFITPKLIKTSEEHLTKTEEQLRTLKRVDYFYYKYRSNAAAHLEARLREERTKAEEARAAAARAAEEQKKKRKAEGKK